MICVSGYDVCLLWMGGGATVYCLRWLSFCFLFFFYVFSKKSFPHYVNFVLRNSFCFVDYKLDKKEKEKLKCGVLLQQSVLFLVVVIKACWENKIARHDFEELYVDWSMVELVWLL